MAWTLEVTTSGRSTRPYVPSCSLSRARQNHVPNRLVSNSQEANSHSVHKNQNTKRWAFQLQPIRKQGTSDGQVASLAGKNLFLHLLLPHRPALHRFKERVRQSEPSPTVQPLLHFASDTSCDSFVLRTFSRPTTELTDDTLKSAASDTSYVRTPQVSGSCQLSPEMVENTNCAGRRPVGNGQNFTAMSPHLDAQ